MTFCLLLLYTHVFVYLPMAMSEEQWVVTDFREVSLPGSKALMDEFQIGKVPRA